MDQPKEMKSEFSVDNQDFTFEATFTPRHWRAKIRNGEGDLCGDIQCGVHGATLEGDALQAAVYDWVCRSIRYRVGVSRLAG